MTPAAFPMARVCPYRLPPGYTGLRAAGPVTRVSLGGGEWVWVVTDHDEVRALLTDPRMSSDSTNPAHPELGLPPGAPRPTPAQRLAVQTFVEMDDPGHRAQRRMVIPYFTVRRARRLRDHIQRTTDRLLDRMLAGTDPADLVTALAVPLPAFTLCRIFGVPQRDHRFFVTHAAVPVRSKKDAGPAFSALADYIDGLLEDPATARGDHLLGELARRVEAAELARTRAVDMVMMLLVAGHETTANTIALGTLTLLAHPGSWSAAPLPAVVEEVLRHSSVADTVPRVAVDDVEIGGQRIRAGDGVILLLAAANRDEAVFPAADDFDPRRPHPRHLSFGYGPHQCLGQNLARVEVEVVLSTLRRRVPALRLARPAHQIPVKPALGLQGVTELPVAWR
ncbi:cytochrome P450 [Actinophytocola sp.]|uniref:cytochrome P450 n=1 Tax=Actinophytocola sp. TaxID=1872138 RepID=UPI00389A4D38